MNPLGLELRLGYLGGWRRGARWERERDKEEGADEEEGRWR